jgi:hypothetical protein
MPALARVYTPISNRVTNLPELPVPIIEGSVNVECGFEQHPSGSISITAIPESEINLYRKELNNLGRELRIYDYWFRISNYAETRDTLEGPGLQTALTTYSVSVNLEGYNVTALEKPVYVKRYDENDLNRISLASTISLKNLAERGGISYAGNDREITIPSDQGTEFALTVSGELGKTLREDKKFIDYSGKTIRLKDLDQGKTFKFTTNEILDSIQSSVQKPSQFLNTRLEGKGGVIGESEAAVRSLRRKNFFGNDPVIKRPPLKRTLIEGDDNPTIVPRDLRTITTLDLNFDSSGPRKSFRRTKYINNKLIEEESFQYGLAYLAVEIHNPLAELPDAPTDTPPLLSQNPQSFWTLIEYRKTKYIYKKLEASARLLVRDKKTKKVFTVVYRDEVGRPISTTFKNKYLVEVLTTGWKLGRFSQEQLNDGNTDSRILREEIDSGENTGIDLEYFERLWEAIQFRKMPLKEQKLSYLEDPLDYYDPSEDVPFETQKATLQDIGLDGKQEVIVATPSRTYIYPMMVISEVNQTHAFNSMDNPENIIIRDERKKISENPNLTDEQKAEELRLLRLQEDLSTGEDTYSFVKREVQPSRWTRKKVERNRDIEEDSFMEYSSSASSQDYKFQHSLQKIKFSENLGRPSSPDVLQDRYARRSELNRVRTPFGLNSRYVNTLTSYYISGKDTSKFYNTLDSISVNTSLLDTAIDSARYQLAVQNFLQASEESITLAWFYPELTPGDFVTTVDTFNKHPKRAKNVSFTLNYQGFVDGELLVTCDGTSVSLGVWNIPSRSDIKINKKFEKQLDGLDMAATYNSSSSNLGTKNVFANVRTRRNRADPNSPNPIPV